MGGSTQLPNLKHHRHELYHTQHNLRLLFPLCSLTPGGAPSVIPADTQHTPHALPALIHTSSPRPQVMLVYGGVLADGSTSSQLWAYNITERRCALICVYSRCA